MEKKRHVLVVDDEIAILRFVSTNLSLAGYRVSTTSDGEEALRLAASEKPDIMLLDIAMLPLNGFQVLDRLRSSSQLPVIVFTARSFIGEKAMEMGANGYIAKPFSPDELISKIEEILDNHRTEAKDEPQA